MSVKNVSSTWVIPNHEIILNATTRARAQSGIKELADTYNIGMAERRRYTDLLENNTVAANNLNELEDFLPCFYETTKDIFHYLGNRDVHTALINSENVKHAAKEQSKTLEAAKSALVENKKDFLDFRTFLSPDDIWEALSRDKITIYEDIGVEPHQHSIDFTVTPVASETSTLIQDMKKYVGAGFHITIACYSDIQQQRLQKLLAQFDLETAVQEKSITLNVGQLDHGFIVDDHSHMFLADREIFGISGKRRKPSRNTYTPEENTELQSLKENAYIVHIDHGIGIFRGMQHLTVGGQESDFALIEYHGGDKLYLPTYRLNLIQPYTLASDSEDQHIALDRLGSNAWLQKKDKVRKAIKEMAQELLKLYASRKVIEGFSFSTDDPQMNEFAASFPYRETTDQATVIEQVLADMQKPEPMDRLICGDVGFGKTEVAMRAAFQAASDGKQVAVLVPTTILAQQHFQTFNQRFQNFPITIDVLNRFRSGSELKESLANITAGKTDIVVGTHRLLSADVVFKRPCLTHN